ncbi:uncharacterized protein LOC117786372 [Drosophila innubila]|uniref:uncharacterized protein LOC117786372 n=1 Tax=Drosophila innubila TaxID=198719 RepID=UPI00148E4546|nr:uncharacterized protein LOC117786372 [Drosophila innubila]
MDEQSSSSDVGSKAKQQELNEEALKNFTTSATSSWTILPAERIEILDSTSDESSIGIKAPGEQESSSEPANERCKPVEDPDPQAEDFSDGISIISDCESTGRLTPNPMFRGLLNELNLDLSSELPSTPRNHQQLRTRRRNAEMEQLEDAPDGQEKAASLTRPNSELSEQPPSIVRYRLPALVQNGLTAVFYVGATLAILAFIGRLKNPEWQVLGGNKPSAELEQRLVDLELQNNLMRAEIDIMAKQLNYLSGQGQSHSQSQSQSQGRKGKTFKAWPGNGNSVDPVDITKQDLKRPYKCPDGKFVEIAGMCMESKPHAESLADEIGNVVNDVLQQSQTFQNFEKVTERLGTLAGNDQPEQASETPKAFHAHAEMDKRQGLPQYNQRSDSSKERYQTKTNYNKCKEHHSNEHTRSKCNEYDSKEYSKERTRSKNNDNDSKEHSKERIRSKSNENDSDEHSKERTRSKSNEYDSKERDYKKYADKSKERYEKKNKQQHRGHNHDSGSGEWHERMMQQREHARQRHEQKRNNNWYIERGGSREQKRSGETRR